MKLRIRLSDVPAETWMQMTLLKPDEASIIYPDLRHADLLMQATWTFDPKQRQFSFCIRKTKWEEALRAIPRRLRTDIKGPVTITFLRDRHYNLSIKEWKNAIPPVPHHRIKKIRPDKSIF